MILLWPSELNRELLCSPVCSRARHGLIWTAAATSWETKHASLSFSIVPLSSLLVSSSLPPHRLLRFMHWFTWHLKACCHGESPWGIFQVLSVCWVSCAHRESKESNNAFHSSLLPPQGAKGRAGVSPVPHLLAEFPQPMQHEYCFTARLLLHSLNSIWRDCLEHKLFLSTLRRKMSRTLFSIRPILNARLDGTLHNMV